MNKKIIYVLTAGIGIFAASCSEESETTETYNPFNEPKIAEFTASSVEIEKKTDNITINESWSNITRDSKNRITDYDYKYNLEGTFSQVETNTTKIDYYTDHLGNEAIRSVANLTYAKVDEKGIEEKYSRKVQENITLNSKGLIESISSIIDHYDKDGNSQMYTSQRSFTYKGNFCTKSIYKDHDGKITYNYNWNNYQLYNITVLKENNDGSIEYNTYDYTFDTKNLYGYYGTEPLPFIQNTLPCIFASMGYFGSCTPYLLLEEVQGGYSKFDNTTSNNMKVKNSYNFHGDKEYRFTYNVSSNIFKTYNIIYNK